jgi:hypothetical protein
MLAGIARLEMHCLIVLVVVRDRPMMLVCGKAVVVLRMIVICVLVDVQRRDLAGGRGQHQSEQDSCNAIHHHECM